MDETSDENVCHISFVPDDKGLVTRFRSPDSDAKFGRSREPGEHCRELRVNAEASQHHGIIIVPVRLPPVISQPWSRSCIYGCEGQRRPSRLP
jgi:hypothetical protein